MSQKVATNEKKIKHLFECRLDESPQTCYKSDKRSIEQMFDSSPKGHIMAMSAPIPSHLAARSTRVRTSGSQRVRLTKRGRFALFFLLSAITVVGMMVAAGGQARATDRSAGLATSSYTVRAGQSLWQIAKVVAPNQDPRVTISQIEDLSGLAGSHVVAGQQLVVPITS